MEIKICSKCKRTLHVSMYSKAKRGINGLSSICKECVAKYHREYREKNIEKLREYDRVHDKFKKKRKKPYRPEHSIVGRAVRLRKINKPLFCVRCWNAGTLHGHHTDYSRPLDVVWLCPSCHGKEHGERIIGANSAA